MYGGDPGNPCQSTGEFSENLNSAKSDPDASRRIIIFAESGLLAGDLAAWLSGRFLVERVTSVPGAALALGQPAGALVLVEGGSLAGSSPLIDLVGQGLSAGCKVLVLGADPKLLPGDWDEKVTFFKAIPEPTELFSSLQDLPLQAGHAEA